LDRHDKSKRIVVVSSDSAYERSAVVVCLSSYTKDFGQSSNSSRR
jgi:hypothetical protein